jgi:hypothetical protein
MTRNYSETKKRVLILGVIVALLSVMQVEGTETELKPRPIIMIHGWGEKCPENGELIECIETGAGFKDSSVDLFKQAERACEILIVMILDNNRNVKDRYKYGFHFIGYSQGGLIVRIVFHNCYEIRIYVKRILTFGSPHLGIDRLPSSCLYSLGLFVFGLCKTKEELSHLSFNQYLNTQSNEDPNSSQIVFPETRRGLIEYLLQVVKTVEGTFMSQKIYNSTEGIINVQFTEDTIIDPISSSLFGMSLDTTTKLVSPFNEAETVGIRELDSRGRIVSCVVNAKHLEFENPQQLLQLLAFIFDSTIVTHEENQKSGLYDRQFQDRIETHTNINCGRLKGPNTQQVLNMI